MIRSTPGILGGTLPTFLADYSLGSINATRGRGNLTGTAFNGATVSGGLLVLNAGKSVDYDAVLNAQLVTTGAINVKFLVKSAGITAGHSFFCDIGKANGSTANLITLQQNRTTKQINLIVHNDNGTSLIINKQLGVFTFTDETDYEIEYNLDISTASSISRVFINKVQHGPDMVRGIGGKVRSDDINILRIGDDISASRAIGEAHFNVISVSVFNTVRHTSDYT